MTEMTFAARVKAAGLNQAGGYAETGSSGKGSGSRRRAGERAAPVLRGADERLPFAEGRKLIPN